jgi:hypothetical protein
MSPGVFVQNDDQSMRVQLVLAVLGLALLAWDANQKKELPAKQKRWRDLGLAALGILGVVAYFNFGKLHFGNFIHTWDTYHYYLGSKYFPELGYQHLYDCTAVADAESGFRDKVEKRIVTDLRTNERVLGEVLLREPERCTRRFTPERWEQFKSDVSFFRKRVHPNRWNDMQKDHGYNATPVWNALGHVLANTGPATQTQVLLLALIDPLYLALMVALVWWAFGWRTLAVAMLMFGTHIPNRFYWTGGAFLRQDWLFYLVACICLLKKGKFALAGASIAYATLLRLFPAFVVIGPALAMAELFRRHRKLDPRYLKFFGSAAATLVVLFLVSLPISGGLGTYRTFLTNTSKHASTPLTNHMGLQTVMGYRPSLIAARTQVPNTIDTFTRWREEKLKSVKRAMPLYVALALAFAALLYLAIRDADGDPWLAAALSTGMIAVGVELTCYYYSFLIGLAVLWLVRKEAGVLLAALCVVTQFIAWSPFAFMSGWEDERMVANSVAMLIAYVGILWAFSEKSLETLSGKWHLRARKPRTAKE